MLKSVLVPLDLKESLSTFRNMISCLKYFGTERVTLLHVRESPRPRKQERLADILHQFAEECRELGMDAQSFVKQGSIADTVCSAAREFEAEFLCLQWKRKNMVKKALLGSTVEDILRLASHPVFIYQRGSFPGHRAEIQRTLYATDFQHTDNAVMPYLTNKDFLSQTLYILHVGERAPDPYAEEKRRETAKSNLQRLAGECSHNFHEVITLEITGSIVSQIARQARHHKVDLIILGKRDKRHPLSELMGSVSENLPDKTNCCLFIVPDIHT